MKPRQAFNLRDWIDRHRQVLQPPVGNKRVFEDGDFIIMVVGGPNSRQDYHVDPGQEFFYQLKGDIVLRTIQDGRLVEEPIRERRSRIRITSAWEFSSSSLPACLSRWIMLAPYPVRFGSTTTISEVLNTHLAQQSRRRA